MKLYLLSHERELTKSTNTGKLAQRCLGRRVEVIVWRRTEPNEDLVNELKLGKAALLFPRLEGESVQDVSDQEFESYIILDATWQQARKMYRQSPYLKLAPKVSLNNVNASTYRLRRNQIEDGLSTVECVIELLKIMGENAKVIELSEAFHTMNNAQALKQS